MIDSAAILELQNILREEYGEELDLTRVESIGEKLVSLYELILQPEGKEVT